MESMGSYEVEMFPPWGRQKGRDSLMHEGEWNRVGKKTLNSVLRSPMAWSRPRTWFMSQSLWRTEGGKDIRQRAPFVQKPRGQWDSIALHLRAGFGFPLLTLPSSSLSLSPSFLFSLSPCYHFPLPSLPFFVLMTLNNNFGLISNPDTSE